MTENVNWNKMWYCLDQKLYWYCRILYWKFTVMPENIWKKYRKFSCSISWHKILDELLWKNLPWYRQLLLSNRKLYLTWLSKKYYQESRHVSTTFQNIMLWHKKLYFYVMKASQKIFLSNFIYREESPAFLFDSDTIFVLSLILQ